MNKNSFSVVFSKHKINNILFVWNYTLQNKSIQRSNNRNEFFSKNLKQNTEEISFLRLSHFTLTLIGAAILFQHGPGPLPAPQLLAHPHLRVLLQPQHLRRPAEPDTENVLHGISQACTKVSPGCTQIIFFSLNISNIRNFYSIYINLCEYE